MLRRSLIVVVVLLAVLAGCSGDDNLAAPKTLTPVTAKVTDPDREVTVSVSELIRNVPPVPGTEISTKRSGMVVVKLDVTVGTTYDIEIGPGAFRLLSGKDNKEQIPLQGRPTEAHLQPLGYPPLASVTEGKSGSGYVAFYISPKGTDAVSFRLHRLPTQIMASLGTPNPKRGTLPEADFDAPLHQ